MKQAVCLILDAADGHVVCVSRRNSTTQWGLPGGKVDPDESVINAVQREVREEIGLSVSRTRLVPIYAGICRGDVDFWVTTFYADGLIVDVESLQAEEGLTIQAMPKSVLLDARSTPFVDYNLNVFEALWTYKENQ